MKIVPNLNRKIKRKIERLDRMLSSLVFKPKMRPIAHIELDEDGKKNSEYSKENEEASSVNYDIC